MHRHRAAPGGFARDPLPGIGVAAAREPIAGMALADMIGGRRAPAVQLHPGPQGLGVHGVVRVRQPVGVDHPHRGGEARAVVAPLQDGQGVAIDHIMPVGHAEEAAQGVMPGRIAPARRIVRPQAELRLHLIGPFGGPIGGQAKGAIVRLAGQAQAGADHGVQLPAHRARRPTVVAHQIADARDDVDPLRQQVGVGRTERRSPPGQILTDRVRRLIGGDGGLRGRFHGRPIGVDDRHPNLTPTARRRPMPNCALISAIPALIAARSPRL